MRWAVILSCLAAPLGAQDFALRASDAPLDAAAMASDVIGATHEFYDGGESFFSISGTYTYTYPDGGRAYGTWDMPESEAEGVICTAFRHGFSRCDRYVRNAGRLVLITEKGDRFPIRRNSADG